MSLYECVFIVRPELSSQDAQVLSARFSEIVSQRNGSIKKIENWGVRSLAYNVKKHKKGNYFMFIIDSSNDAIKELERNFKINENVIKYFTVRIKKFVDTPSIMMSKHKDKVSVEQEEIRDEE